MVRCPINTCRIEVTKPFVFIYAEWHSVTDGLPVLCVVKAVGLAAEGHRVQVMIQVDHWSIRILTCCQLNVGTSVVVVFNVDFSPFSSHLKKRMQSSQDI